MLLFVQLLWNGFYCIGTIMRYRIGFPEQCKFNKGKHDRGRTIVAKCIEEPSMVAWMDNREVNMLSTGVGTQMSYVLRNTFNNDKKTYERKKINCPLAVSIYISKYCNQGSKGKRRDFRCFGLPE